MYVNSVNAVRFAANVTNRSVEAIPIQGIKPKDVKALTTCILNMSLKRDRKIQQRFPIDRRRRTEGRAFVPSSGSKAKLPPETKAYTPPELKIQLENGDWATGGMYPINSPGQNSISDTASIIVKRAITSPYEDVTTEARIQVGLSTKGKATLENSGVYQTPIHEPMPKTIRVGDFPDDPIPLAKEAIARLVLQTKRPQ